MTDEVEKTAIELCDAVQLQMARHDTNAVLFALSLLTADIAVNVSQSQETGCDVIDHIATVAKEKMHRDWGEGKERLAAQRANPQTQTS